MLRRSKLVPFSIAGLTYSMPAFAHPGHGADNPLLHKLQHLMSGLDPVLAALCLGVLALALVAALYARAPRAYNRR